MQDQKLNRNKKSSTYYSKPTKIVTKKKKKKQSMWANLYENVSDFFGF